MDRAACHGSEHPPPPPDRPLAARGTGRKPWHILGENGWRILTENLHSARVLPERLLLRGPLERSPRGRLPARELRLPRSDRAGAARVRGSAFPPRRPDAAHELGTGVPRLRGAPLVLSASPP